MKNCILNFIHEEEGAGLVEYALLIAFIAVVAILAITTLGTTVTGSLTTASGIF